MGKLTVEQVYSDFHEKILWFILSRINDRDQAEDITEDIFVKIAEHLSSFDPEKASIVTWVYTIANRSLTDYYRKCKVFVELPEDNGEDGKLPTALVDDEDLDKNLLMEEQLHELAAALKKLPEREMDLIILHYYYGFTLKEIAVKMAMSYANAKVVHGKALAKLNKELAGKV